MINQNQMRRGRFGRWKPLQAKIRKDAGQPVILRSKQKIQDGKASALLFDRHFSRFGGNQSVTAKLGPRKKGNTRNWSMEPASSLCKKASMDSPGIPSKADGSTL